MLFDFFFRLSERGVNLSERERTRFAHSHSHSVMTVKKNNYAKIKKYKKYYVFIRNFSLKLLKIIRKSNRKLHKLKLNV
jgi:hypothetical protein